jgi:hypothetical protein
MCVGTSQFGMPIPPSLNIDPVQKMMSKKADKNAGPNAPKRSGVASPDALTMVSSQAVGGLLS